jgi:nitrogenase molybdenum-iron protein alpha/beta subunit
MEKNALKVIERETRKVEPDLAYLKKALSGKTAIIEISEFPGPIRALSLARMAEEFGAHPVVVNVHPYTIKERMPSIKYMLETNISPEIILTKVLFRLGSFRSSKETADELEGRALVEHAPSSNEAEIFLNLAKAIMSNNSRVIPTPVSDFVELEKMYREHRIKK